jgi:predicted dinucleotide-utilizing enzyme
MADIAGIPDEHQRRRALLQTALSSAGSENSPVNRFLMIESLFASALSAETERCQKLADAEQVRDRVGALNAMRLRVDAAVEAAGPRTVENLVDALREMREFAAASGLFNLADPTMRDILEA